MNMNNIELLGKAKAVWFIQQMIQNWPHILHCMLSLSYYTLHLCIIESEDTCLLGSYTLSSGKWLSSQSGSSSPLN